MSDAKHISDLLEPRAKELAAVKTEKEKELGRLRFVPWNEFESREFHDPEWAVENLIPADGITILSGQPGSFKTWMILDLAISVAQGRPFAGKFEASQSPVLIIDEENQPRLIQARLRKLGVGKDDQIHILSRKEFRIQKEDEVSRVIAQCKEMGVKLVIIDSLVRIHGSDENSSTEMSKVFREISRFTKEGITVLLTHHEGKEQQVRRSGGGRLRGSSDILAAVDAHISVRRGSREQNMVTLEQTKMRNTTEIEPFNLMFESAEDVFSFLYIGKSERESKNEVAKKAILDLLKGKADGMNRGEIEAVIGKAGLGGESTVRAAINEHIADGRVIETTGEKNEKICRLPDESRASASFDG